MSSFVSKFRFHTEVITHGICLSLSGWLHWVWSALSPPMWQAGAFLLTGRTRENNTHPTNTCWEGTACKAWLVITAAPQGQLHVLQYNSLVQTDKQIGQLCHRIQLCLILGPPWLSVLSHSVIPDSSRPQHGRQILSDWAPWEALITLHPLICRRILAEVFRDNT